MGMQEKKQVICQLIEQGKTNGQLCTSKILEALGDLNCSVAQMEKLYDALNVQNIQIVEDLGNLSGVSEHDDGSNAGAIDVYLKTIREIPPVTEEEERSLLIRIGEGDMDAKQRLAEGYLWLVVRMAGDYQHRGLQLLDLIQEGNVGLLKAAEQFDDTKWRRFPDYAVWWIRHTILRAVAEQGNVSAIPEDDADWHTGEILIGSAPLAQEEPADPAHLLQMKEKFDEIIQKMSSLEQEIVCLRFGLRDGHTYTMEEVARRLNIPRARVRQTETKALRKLRHPGCNQTPKNFPD